MTRNDKAEQCVFWYCFKNYYSVNMSQHIINNKNIIGISGFSILSSEFLCVKKNKKQGYKI